MEKKVNVGIIGCGNISGVYLKTAERFPVIEVVAGADIDAKKAKETAKEYGIEAVSVDALLTDSDIEIVLNLTVPQAHSEVKIHRLHHMFHQVQSLHCTYHFFVLSNHQ